MKPTDLDRMAFRKEFILLEDGSPFGEKVEAWQEEDFAALDSGEHRHAYLERPRGHSKTGDLGTEAVTELILGRPGQALFCAAADEGQASLLFEDVKGKFERHPALRHLVKVTSKEIIVKATGSRLKVLASDAPSAYGLRPDWIAVDELPEWRGRALWDSLWSATGKGPRRRMMVIGTAGWDKASVAWEVRQNAERESDWYFRSRGQCASWIRPEWLAQQRRTLPLHVFQRLHLCQWVDGGGAWLSSEQVEAIFGDVPDGTGESRIGLDIGISRDRTVIAHVANVAGVRVVRGLVTFRPSTANRVDLGEVEEACYRLAAEHGCPIIIDPFQAIGLAQRLRTRGIDVVEHTFTSEKRRTLFGRLLDLVATGRLRAHPHEELRHELLALEVKETQAGWRVDHRASGHDDHVVAVALALSGLADEQGELCFVYPSETVQTVAELETEAAVEFAERCQAAIEVVADSIRRTGVYWPGE